MAFILVLAIIGAFFVAFNNGANDVANAFASAVGSKALKIKHALLIAALLNLTGAVLLGANVSKTLIEGVVNVKNFSGTHSYLIGMLACMIAAGSFTLISTYTGMPVSSTHAIVGAMMGVAAVSGGFNAINWRSLKILTASWIITPFVSAACAYGTIKLIRLTVYRGKREEIMDRACRWIPLFATGILAVVAIAIFHGARFAVQCSDFRWIYLSLILAFPFVYFAIKLATRKLVARFRGKDFGVEHVFRRFQAGTSCLIGFAIGSNDVANSITPVAAIYFITKLGALPDSLGSQSIPIWLLMIGGIGMSVGVLSLGHRVITTLGKNITLLTNSRGFSVDFATATTIILASVIGIPVSSTHAATGSIIGVGMERRIKTLNIRLLLRIFIAWTITVPMSALFTIFVYLVLRAITFPFISV